MEMGIGEIRRQYKYAKDRKKCISILAELNCCSKDEIKTILGLNGEHNTKSRTQKEQRITLNTKEINSLYTRLDELNSAIRPMEDEYRRTLQMILSAESIKISAVVQEKEG